MTQKIIFILAWCQVALLLIGSIAACTPLHSSKENQKINMQNSENLSNLEIATLGAGCFWCVEAVYQEVEGVHKVVSGYTGGHVKNPAYREVCNGTTGHAEVVQVYFDPQVISFADILEVFWHTHNPTTLNQQGNDKGTQYRSAIFYQNEQQKKIAEKSLKETDASDLWADPIVTEISPLGVFYEAEDYHQDYFANNGNQPYCSFVINPKVQKFRKEFKHRLKKQTQD